MKRREHLHSQRQKGQFLPHLAEIFVSAGIVIGVALQGSAVLEKFEYASAYQDLKRVENALWDYRDQHGIWLDECEAQNGANSADACRGQVYGVLDEINTLNSDAEPGITYSLTLVDSANGVGKYRAISISGLEPEFARYLDEKIDGETSMERGRVKYLNPNQHEIVYFYESKLN